MLKPTFQLACLVFLLFGFRGLSAQPPSLPPPTQPLIQPLSPSHTAQLQLTPTPHFVVTGLTSQLGKKTQSVDYPSLFAIHVQSDQPHTPSLLGEYRVDDATTLSFIPRYPLSPAVVYCLRVGDALRRELSSLDSDKRPASELHFQLPSQPPATATSVSAIYPTADKLPENLLKFYIHFSAPMSRGQAYERIQLFHGQELVPKPFLELGEELWDTQQQRFTLFIHPGRIKHGLRSRDEAGPALLAGEIYTLRVDQAWMDAAGFPLVQTFEKTFTAIRSDDAQLNPERWQIEAPAAGSTDAVSLKFDEPLDQAMLSHVLDVKSRDGNLVAGSHTIAPGETEWRFTPAEKWKTGTYHIEVATILEDLCGNSLAKAFEVDMRNIKTTPAEAHIAIEFIVK